MRDDSVQLENLRKKWSEVCVWERERDGEADRTIFAFLECIERRLSPRVNATHQNHSGARNRLLLAVICPSSTWEKKKKKNLCLPAMVFIFHGGKSCISSANKNLFPVIIKAHLISIWKVIWCWNKLSGMRINPQTGQYLAEYFIQPLDCSRKGKKNIKKNS